mmetsp:Transcript_18133/g.38091  ORF Transcript_18133/g.38091 Transcript_18133/m.38091 type:complete len:174 (-) Transcript_18133:709-1230(-)
MMPTAIATACVFVSLLLPPPSSAYTTIDDAAESALLWSSGQFAVLLDVRRQEEWDAGHLPNATFMPSMQTSKDTSRLTGCENCSIAVYCRSGRRSKEAAVVLEDAGFMNVYDVLGINQWIDAGVALVLEEERDPSCCDATCVATRNCVSKVGSRSVVAIVIGAISAALFIAIT